MEVYLMEHQSFEALEARFHALQRQVITLVTACCIVVVGLLGAWVFTTTRNLGVVRARAIEIVDDNGKVIMGMHFRGYYDNLYPNSYHAAETPIIWMNDRNGRTRISLGVGDNGEPQITLRDELGRASVVLCSQSSGTQGLRIFNSSGDVLFSAP
jgi:hypothetical protein